MRVNYIEIFVGAIVLIVAGTFFSYAYKANKSSGGFEYVLTAEFERVDGILKGTDIKLRGIKVGEVTKMALEGEKLNANLTLSFYTDLKLPLDTVAEVASEGIMGPKYISINPGENETALKSGEKIGYTQPSISLESLIARFVFNAKE